MLTLQKHWMKMSLKKCRLNFWTLIEGDMDSRKDWADTYVKGLDVLGFQYEETV